MLEVSAVTKHFGNGSARKTVLNGISFSVEKEEFVTLLGPSGCGKTTLLTIMAGFQSPSEGEIRIADRVVYKPGPDRGFVFQDYALFPWMTVRDNVLFPLREKKVPRVQQEKRLAELLRMAHLEGKEDLYPGQLSGGMKQRTAFIRALAGSPDALLLDEPLGAVDPQMRQQLQDELLMLWMKEQKTVIMVTHDVDEAVYLSDRIIILSSVTGRIEDEVCISLPRPRQRLSSAYIGIKNEVFRVLQRSCTRGDSASEDKTLQVS